VKPGVVLVPRESVFVDETGSYVFVEDQGKATLRRIQTGITVHGSTEITGGLSPGEAVVVEGAAVLSDGMQVRQPGVDGGPTR
jgi:membrane fusion protein (multidrug efflux system)